jgi:hypothetical protein
MNTKLPQKETPTIPAEDWEKLVVESDASKELMDSSKFKFFREYFKNAKDSAIMLVATNAIKDVVETNSDPKTGYSKSIKTTKEEQLNEIAGVIKFIDKLLGDFETLAREKDTYLKMEEEKKVVIEVSKEK